MLRKQSTLHNPQAIMLTIPCKFRAVPDRKKNGEDRLEKERRMGEYAEGDLL